MAKTLTGSQHDLGGFTVTRILPNAAKRMIGPFIFFDHMGPAEFRPGPGIEVAPHPHIGLATLTYLFEGELLHRDSLGNVQAISPGDVNWMVAGNGIVHSERETIERKTRSRRIDGIQAWLALPRDQAEVDPCFQHVSRHDLPHINRPGVTMRLIAGSAYGRTSPVNVFSPTFYLDVLATAGASIEIPDAAQETGIYLQSGRIQIGELQVASGELVLLDEGDVEIVAETDCRYLLLGGDRFSEVPHIHWNFVSFDAQRIDQARADWSGGRFPVINEDRDERIPLPEAKS